MQITTKREQKWLLISDKITLSKKCYKRQRRFYINKSFNTAIINIYPLLTDHHNMGNKS